MLDDDEVVSAQLEAQLASHGETHAVLNAGKSGASLADYIHYAEDYRKLFHPAWTVIVVNSKDFGSDAWSKTKVLPGWTTPLFERDGEQLKIVLNPAKSEPRYAPLLRKVPLMSVRYAIVRLLQYAEGEKAQPRLFRAAEAGAPPKDLYEEDPNPGDYPIEEELDALVKAWDGRVTIFFLSRLHWDEPGQMGVTEARFKAHCAERHYSCVDSRSDFDALVQRGESAYGFPNSRFSRGHLNATGHALAAREIATELKALHAHGLF